MATPGSNFGPNISSAASAMPDGGHTEVTFGWKKVRCRPPMPVSA